MKKISIVAIVLSICTLSLQLFILATNDKPNNDIVYKEALPTNYKILAPVLPDTLSFAGEPVPLDVFYVRENLDRALLMQTYWQSNTILIMKRANRYFPVIEEILKKEGIPNDFKYLCVVESFLTNATSPAKAQGFWQFMKATGEKYDLEVTKEVDERNSIEKSTKAAAGFLKQLYKSLGSWTAAAAAYNCGQAGLTRQIDLQSIDAYYDLHLNQETAFYIYRILAAKMVLQNPQEYGYFIREKDLYPPIPTRVVSVDSTINCLYTFAKENNTNYRMLKILNPWLIDSKLPNPKGKKYAIELPVKDGTLQAHIQKNQNTEMVNRL